MLFCGAAPLSAALTENLVRLLPNAHIGQGYGLYSDPRTMSREAESAPFFRYDRDFYIRCHVSSVPEGWHAW
jgi:hypothetical protein